MVEIRSSDKDDYKAIAAVFKQAFLNIKLFQQDEKKIVSYLENCDGTFYVAEEDEKIIGAMLLSAENLDNHILWRISHAAILPEWRGKGLGVIMIEYIDEKIMSQIKKGSFNSAKVEVHISENDKVFSKKSEDNDLQFWKGNGFRLEGKLNDHFKKGEMCYILGKSF